jgi:hypothetical protein
MNTSMTLLWGRFAQSTLSVFRTSDWNPNLDYSKQLWTW